MSNPTDELLKRIKANRKSLNIARLPDKIKEDFTNFANEEFCGDYGMAFREVFNCYREYNSMKFLFFQNIDMKLDVILDKLNDEKEEKPETRKIKMVNGRIVEREGKQNE